MFALMQNLITLDNVGNITLLWRLMGRDVVEKHTEKLHYTLHLKAAVRLGKLCFLLFIFDPLLREVCTETAH